MEYAKRRQRQLGPRRGGPGRDWDKDEEGTGRDGAVRAVLCCAVLCYVVLYFA